MALPVPEPGLVLGYNYLWTHEHDAGLEEGRKARPCAVILAREVVNGVVQVSVVPITHSPPDAASLAIEIPAAVKRHLGLDSERSWIVVSEYNAFNWPGADLAPVSRETPDQFSYGLLPPALYEEIRSLMLEGLGQKKTRQVTRTS